MKIVTIIFVCVCVHFCVYVFAWHTLSLSLSLSLCVFIHSRSVLWGPTRALEPSSSFVGQDFHWQEAFWLGWLASELWGSLSSPTFPCLELHTCASRPGHFFCGFWGWTQVFMFAQDVPHPPSWLSNTQCCILSHSLYTCFSQSALTPPGCNESSSGWSVTDLVLALCVTGWT